MRRDQSLLAYSGVALLLVLLVLSPRAAFGQLSVTTATLSGTVTDPSGAAVTHASVSLTSAEKGITRVFTTNGTGQYSFNDLPPATYTLTIQVQGFEQYQQNGISLDAGQSARQNVALKIGSQSEKVEVTSEAPLLNTENANITADVNGKQIVELPLNLRNVLSLATLNSSVNNVSNYEFMLGGNGVSTDNADQDLSFMGFAGGFFGTTGYLLDGVWDMGADWGGTIYVPSVDDVQEMKIQNNSFTAQYGWSTGNVLNMVTKSGTDQFHGDVYGFYRNSALDANLWFNDYYGQSKQAFHRDQDGIAAGGPLYIPGLYKQRDKTFFFGVYEHLDLATPLVGTFTVPDANSRAGNFTEYLGPQVGSDALGRPIYSGQIYNPRSARPITAGQVDPSTGLVATQTGYIRDPIPGNNVAALGPFDQIGAALVGYFPKPTNSALSNNYTTTATAPANSNEYSGRVDQNLGGNSRFYVRYSYKQEFKTNTPEYWGSSNPAGPGNRRPNNRYNLVGSFTHVFSPTLTMNLVSGFEHWAETSTNQSKGFQPSTIGLPSYLDTHSPEFPIVNIGVDSTLGPSNGGESVTIRPTGSLSADFIKLLGRQTLSFGFMGVENELNTQGFDQTTLDFGGEFTLGPDPTNPTPGTGNGVAQALLGVLDNGENIGANNSNTGIKLNPAIAKHYLGWYLQDDWKVVPRFTLNLGIRYEIQTAPTFRRNDAAYFNPTVPNPIGTSIGQALPGALIFLSPGNRDSYDTNYGNVAPRVGFSYQIRPNLVFRGGYGIFYPVLDPLNNASTDGFSSNSAVVDSLNNDINPNPAVTTANPWPNGFVPITGNSLGELQDVGYGVGSNFNHITSSYVEQYMAGFQYALGLNDSIDVSYVGNRGIHMLFSSLNPSQLNPSYLSMGASALDQLVANPFFGYITLGASSCGLDQATVVQSQLLQPFRQYCGVSDNVVGAGFSNYNAFEANYNHRFRKGLSVLVSYTFSKFLDNTEGAGNWAYIGSSGPANNYNLAAEKSVDAGNTPNSLVASYVYELPVGTGRAVGTNFNHATNAVLAGWEVSGVSSFKSGFPIGVNGNDINSYGGNPRPDVIGDLHTPHPNVHEWFNTGAFTYANFGTFGTAPRFFSNLSAPGYQDWDLALMKNWAFNESRRLQFRAEMYNAFNHPQFYAPQEGYNGCDPNSSVSCSSNFGQITSAFPSRQVQLSGKFYW